MQLHDIGVSSDRRRRGLPYWLLSGASALAICSVLTTPVMAQDEPEEEDTEVVVVRGLRGSLMSSQQLKRESEVVVDSITAQDIGALPDRSVTEAIQRIPGVAIDRFDAGRDPDHFSVEGSGVVVRGLTFVRSELNGRDTFSANNGRELSFSDVPSELLGGVDVFKSPSADMIEGGIAGTVNLRTRVPFDQDGLLISGSIESSYADLAQEWAPTSSVLVSDRFETGAGEFGFLLAYVDSELKSRADGTQISDFGCRTNIADSASEVVTCQTVDGPQPGVYFPRGAAFRMQEFDRERIGKAAAFQWESPDQMWLATAQFLSSEATQAWTEHAIEIATDNVAGNGDSFLVGPEFGFDSNGVFNHGYISGTTGWRDDQNGADPRTPINGLQSNNIRRDSRQDYVTTDYGFNLKFTPTEQLAFNFDYQHVDSTVDALDIGIWGSTYQNVYMQLRGDDAPLVYFLPPAATGTVDQSCINNPPSNACPTYYNAPHDSFSDPYNSFWRSAMAHAEASEGQEDAIRLDAEYSFDSDSWLDAVRVGARWSERDQTTRFSTYNWGVLSEQWGSGGPVWMDDPVNGDPNTPGGSPTYAATELFDWENFFRNKVPLPIGDEGRLFYADHILDNYDEFVAFALSVGDEWRPRNGANGCNQNWVPLDQRCNVIPGTFYLPQEVNPVLEETNAAYAMVSFDQDLVNGQALSGNVGVRYVKTDRSADGFLAYALGNFTPDETCQAQILAYEEAIAIDPNQTLVPEPTEFCQLTPAQRQDARDWSNGAISANTVDHGYEYWLPSLNLKYELNDSMQVRFSASKAISLPPIGLVRNYHNLSLDVSDATIEANGVPVGIVTVGNARLDPIESTNFDATFEWYFDENVGSLTLAAFYKSLEGVLTNTTVREPYTNNGITYDVLVTTPGNATEDGAIQGFEIAYQQFYDEFLPPSLEGLGLSANYTYIDSSGVPQSTLSETDANVAAGNISTVDTSLLPLQGLSEHNFNIAGIYQRGPVQARLAYNWRSEFLLTVRDVIVPFAPIMNDDTGQLDGSFFVDVSDNVTIGVQGVNLTNEITRTKSVLNDDLLMSGRSWFMNDRRFTIVARATF